MTLAIFKWCVIAIYIAKCCLSDITYCSSYDLRLEKEKEGDDIIIFFME